jgi:hypothetical protein
MWLQCRIRGHNVSQTDASVAVVVSGNTHNVWRIMYPQYNTQSLQHVCRSHNAFRIIHPIGIYTHNASVPGRSIKHPIAMYIHNAFRSIHPMAIYTHNLIRIIHPIAINTHNAIRFVFNVFTACLQCRVNCVSIHTHKKNGKRHSRHISVWRAKNVPRLSYGLRMLTEDGAPNRFFLMYLFCNESMAIHWQSVCVYKIRVVVPAEFRNQVRQRK